MKSLWQREARQEILARFERLTPDSQPRWGKMNATGMAWHMARNYDMAFGEITVPSKMLPIRFFPLKQLIVYVLPFPKGAPTAPELVHRGQGEFVNALHDCVKSVERFGTEQPTRAWPDHPVFGKIGAKGWGVLGYKHADHHLRQFGV